MPGSRTNQEWLEHLTHSGDLQSAAIEELRGLLLRAALFTLNRNARDLVFDSPEEIRQSGEDCAQEALIAVLNNLSKFRGESKFTTWAYKFAVNISLTSARRQRWKGVSLDHLAEESSQDGWLFEYIPKLDPGVSAERGEIITIISDVIQNQLIDKQRLVLKWMVFDEVPMDVVVEKLNTNRNAVYKLLHDARRKLKRSLLLHGIGVGETIDLFG